MQDILKTLYIKRFLGVKNLSTISTISTIRATVPFWGRNGRLIKLNRNTPEQLTDSEKPTKTEQ